MFPEITKSPNRYGVPEIDFCKEIRHILVFKKGKRVALENKAYLFEVCYYPAPKAEREGQHE